MNVLMISNDRAIFDESSAVRRRMIEYGNLVERLDIIVFSREGYAATHLSDVVTVYPTNSSSRYAYIFDAIKIGKQFQKISLVTAQDFFEGFAGFRIARKAGAKLELQVHTDMMSPYFTRGNFLNLLRRILARFLLPRADCVRVVSERIRKSIVYLTKAPISVLPIFTDIAAVQNAPITTDLHKKYPQFKKIVLMVSRLEPEKNISLALAAFADIKNSNTCLVIVGKGGERAALSRRVQELDIGERVFFEGHRKDVFSYYKTADAFLQTSNYEGYGLALLEAFVAGLPIVTTDVGVAGGIVSGMDVGIAPVGNAKRISALLIKVLSRGKPSKKPLLPKEITLSHKEYLLWMRALWERCGNPT